MKRAPKRPKDSSKPAGDAEPRARAVAPMSDAVRAYLRATGLDARLRASRIHEAWARAVGPALAERARSVLFRDGELVVEVASSAHLGELRGFTGEQYRVAANRILGSERITRVTFKLRR